MAHHLTDALVKRLPAPTKGNKIFFDDEVASFGCRVTTGGNRSFVLNYRVRGTGRERRFTIGGAGDWRTTAARAEARRLKQFIDQGGDPLADLEIQREAPTMSELADRFEAEHCIRKRASTAEEYKRMLRIHIKPFFGAHTKVGDVVFADVEALHRKISKTGATYAANRCVAVLSKMFSLAIRWGMCTTTNPARGIERNTEFGRRRYLSADELARLTAALAAHPDRQAANIIRMLLLTGARRGEVLAARWSDIDLATGTWAKPAASTKQKLDHEVPLSAPARLLLNTIREQQMANRRPVGEYVFPGSGVTGHVADVKKFWRQVCKAASIEGLRVHDLRHSFASQLASGGASLPLIGALLGHSNPSTTARYAHLFDDPQRAAVEKVGRVIVDAGPPSLALVRVKLFIKNS